MIKLLPHWVLTSTRPAFYDTESGSTLEQTARVYGKMQELIEDYNKFVDEINKSITEFIEGGNKDSEAFKTCITSLIENYITCIDSKMNSQDLKLKVQDERIEEQNSTVYEAVTYFKTRVDETIGDLIADMKASGEFDQAILDAIDNITNSYNTLNERVTTLENTNYAVIYDSYTEEIRIEKVVGGA